LLSEILTEFGYQVTAYSNPLQYLNISEGQSFPLDGYCFDAILTDNKMPGMTGLEFLEKLDRERCCHLPNHRKAIISGDWPHQHQTKARQHGYKTFHKPTELNQILAWLQEAVTY
jgi:CheY-like chemotaxis protein